MGKRVSVDAALVAHGLYMQGLTLVEVAPSCGITAPALWRVFRRLGLQMRPMPQYVSRGAASDERSRAYFRHLVRSGALVRPETCSECGTRPGPRIDGKPGRIQGHHDDYNFPEQVRWLCAKCHSRWHKHNQAIPANGQSIRIRSVKEDWVPGAKMGRGRLGEEEVLRLHGLHLAGAALRDLEREHGLSANVLRQYFRTRSLQVVDWAKRGRET